MPNRLSRFAAVAAVAVLSLTAPAVRPRAVSAAGAGEYYYNAGRRVPVTRSDTRVAVRVGDGAAKAGVAASLASAPGVVATRDVGSGVVEVTLDASAAKSATDGVAAIARASGGDLLPVFFEGGAERDASTLFVHDVALARFRADVTRAEVDALGARLGFTTGEPLRYATNGFRLEVAGGDLSRNALTVANAVYESGLAEWAHPDFLAHRALRFAPDDPQYGNQWHLNNTGQGGGTPGADVKAEAAWDITRGNPSISVAVADTGIDVAHEDFAVSVGGMPKVHDSRDVVHGDDDPTPQPGDQDGSHGTAASGVAVAAGDNGLDTSGIAPNCRLVPIQLYAESTFTPNATEADAFTWAADHADVMSNSWGPDDDDVPLPDATRAAMDYATTNGRGGKGLVIFFAAGNSNDDTVHDNYVSYSKVIAVAASTNLGVRSSYSRFGAAVSVSAPSNGGTLGITTTDVTGQNGYSTLNFTNGFGGTSSACPLAAGIAALVLSENPSLTWQEVKSVLEQTADKIDPGAGAYDATGRSIYYGFGRVNALGAVTLARDLADPSALNVALAGVGEPVVAGGVTALSWSIRGTSPVASQTLEYSADGTRFVPIATPPPGTTHFDWTVPSDVVGSITVRITVTSTDGQTATSSLVLVVRLRPAITGVKLATSASGKKQLVVDGTAFVVGDAVIYVGDTALTALKFPKGRQNPDGTATRIVSKDSRLKTLVPKGVSVTVTVRESGGLTSEPFTYQR